MDIYRSCSLNSTPPTSNMVSVAPWHSAGHLHDAHATPYVVPNEVASLCVKPRPLREPVLLCQRVTRAVAQFRLPRYAAAVPSSLRPGCEACACGTSEGTVCAHACSTSLPDGGWYTIP